MRVRSVLDLLESARAWFARHRLGELIERVRGSSSLCLEQCLMNGLDVAEAMDHEAADFKQRHFRESAHLLAVAEKDCRRPGVQVPPCARLAAGQDEGRGHALHVPLEGAADGFIEIVDVEDEAAVGRGEGAEVAHVGIAAELRVDAGVGKHGEVGSHDRRGAAEVAEGRLRHELMLELKQRGNASPLDALQQGKRRRFARLDVELVVFLAAHLLTPRLAENPSFFRRCPVHASDAPPHCMEL